MQLLLVRHALPERVEGGATPADPPLTPHGRDQAAALARWLEPEGIDAICTSPLRRARQTAEPLCATTGLAARVEEGIAEFDRGFDFYIPLEDLKREDHPHWRVLSEGRWDEMPADLEAFRTRVVEGIEEIVAANPGRRVAVVCHGGVVNAYVAQVLGIQTTLFFEPAYTGITRIEASRGGVRSLVSLNETGHLRALG